MPVNGKRVYRKKPSMAKKTTASSTSSFNSRVMSVIKRNSEKKLKIFNLINTGNVPGSGVKFDTGSGDTGPHTGIVVAPLSLMALAQSTAQDGRIGNKIGNVYLNIRGFVHSLNYNDTTNPSASPYEVHVLAYKNKHDRAGDFTRLKQGLNNTLEEISGSAMSSLRPFNKDEYIIKFHKIMKLNANPEVATSAAGSMLVNPQVGQNPAMRRFSYRVPVAKNLIFRDDENVPQNDWVHIAVYVVNGDGDELARSIERCQVQMDGYITYTDA